MSGLDPAAEIETIDMHTHVFNLRYFPIEGILNYRLHRIPKLCRAPIARGLAKILNAITRDGSALAPERIDAMAATMPEPVESIDALITSMAAAVPEGLRHDKDVRAGVLASTTTRPDALLLDTAMAVTFKDSPERADFALLLSNLRLVDVTHFIDTAADYIRWFAFLTNDEQSIVNALLASYPVDLYIHHMMDLEHYYKPGGCRYEFTGEQISRMRRLVEHNQGRLLTFVAWSPKRPHGLDLIEDTVTSGGAIGVKIYPASGYLPSDKINDDLWPLAEKLDLPLFSHCMFGGFEAAKKFESYPDPKHWLPVLQKHPQLRLCLGHAGGQEGWFAKKQKEWDKSYAKTVVELCETYEHVYCESGFLPKILDPGQRLVIVDRLRKCFKNYPHFAGKFMYGTDWHMIERIEHHRDYFAAFQDVFRQLGADPKPFFYANAVSYLNLSGFLARHAQSRTFNVEAVRPHLERVQAKGAAMRRLAQ